MEQVLIVGKICHYAMKAIMYCTVRRVRRIFGESAFDKFDSKATETELHKQEVLLLDGILHHCRWERLYLSLQSSKAADQDWLKDIAKSSFLVLSGWNGSQVNASFS